MRCRAPGYGRSGGGTEPILPSHDRCRDTLRPPSPGSGWSALDEPACSAPAGSRHRVLGPNGAGKTTAIECAVGLGGPTPGRCACSTRTRRPPAPTTGRESGSAPERGLPNGARPMRLLEHLARFYAEPPTSARWRRGSACPTSPGRRSGASPADRSSASRSRPRCSDDPTCSSSTSRLPASTRTAGSTSGSSCASCATRHDDRRHDASFEEAERLADHLVIMNAGRTVAEGSVAEVVGGRSLEDVYFSLTRKGAA